MIEYQDIENPVLEKSNMGGAWQNVYYAPKKDFAELAEVPDEDGDRDYNTMNFLSVGQDRLKPGKRLYTAYSTLEKVSLEAEPQGEYDSMSYKIVLKMFTPGLTSTALAMLKIPNQDWIFYVRTGKQMFRVGGNQFAAKKAPEGRVGTGETTGSAKGSELVFHTYEDGYAPEVVDIDAILAMRNSVDVALTLAFNPLHAAVAVAVATDPTITFAVPVINADTLQAFTNQEIESIIQLYSLDMDGNKVSDKPFTAAIVNEVVTITPNVDFALSTMYQLKFDATKVLSSANKGRINGSNYIRFTTTNV